MNDETEAALGLSLDDPISPEEFGRWVFHHSKPLQHLAASGDLKPWQIAFFAGLESFMRQSYNNSEESTLHTYPTMGVPKLRHPGAGS